MDGVMMVQLNKPALRRKSLTFEYACNWFPITSNLESSRSSSIKAYKDPGQQNDNQKNAS